MYCKWKTVKYGMITVEASIIVPIVMFVITSVIFMSFYMHDIISIRSGVYLYAFNYGKNTMPSMFVLCPQIVKTETESSLKVKVYIKKNKNNKFLKYTLNRNSEETLTIQKTMNTEILYAARAIMDMRKEEN
ncbi:MAG: pilus assembly protein [Eubacterium sp.]|nr:pilus assembly protein [Eubacterium sp.]